MDTLADLLSSRVKAEILRLLFGLSSDELHVREIARRAGLNDATVRQELKRLIGHGLVEVRRDGNRTYCRANNRHPLYRDLRGLVVKTSGLAEVLGSALGHPGIRLAFVFGLLAGDTGNADSDVDLLVIGDVSLRELSKLLPGAAAELGREINPYILTARDFQRRREGGERFLTTVLGAPKLFVIGDEHELAAMGGKQLLASLPAHATRMRITKCSGRAAC